MPLPACAVPLTVTGGQAAAHAPVQVDVPLVSASHRYSARPFPSTRALSSIPVMDFRLTVTAALADAEAAAAGLLACAAADAGADDAGGPAAVLPEPLEQAVAVSATAAAQAAAAIQVLIMMLPVVGGFP